MGIVSEIKEVIGYIGHKRDSREECEYAKIWVGSMSDSDYIRVNVGLLKQIIDYALREDKNGSHKSG